MYLDDGKMTYLGGTEGLMDVVDYRRIKLPARVVLDRARQDPAPVFVASCQTPSSRRKLWYQFEGVHFRYDED